MRTEIIYFELNNWAFGRDYPDTEPFISWFSDDLNQRFLNDKWCKENKLCVTHEMVDMSSNYKITATKNWVVQNCPQLLEKQNSKFIYNLNEDDYDKETIEYFEGSGYGEGPYLKWCEENFGCHEYFNDEFLDYKDEDE